MVPEQTRLLDRDDDDGALHGEGRIVEDAALGEDGGLSLHHHCTITAPSLEAFQWRV